jgi:deoxyadenosine/deoxycytidine kinase
MEPILISLDGSIGAGKSTFLAKLKEKYPHWNYIEEPVDTWSQFINEDGESLIEVFYKDRQRWSYTFQNCAFLTRVRGITKAIKDWKKRCETNPEEIKRNVFITERCVDTDFNVFAKMLHADKSINKMEWDMYRQWYRFLSVDCKLNAIVYIRCSPEKCKERIGIRSRNGEDNIPLEYLQQLHKYHEDWIMNTSIPVHEISTEKDNDYNDAMFTKFENFISKID